MAKKKKNIRKGRDYRTSKNTDGLRKSKPSGYRFRGENNFSKPTQKQIQEHLDHKRDDIYFENRPERSDKKPFSKRGNRFKKGGLIITPEWGNDGSTPSNNKDYNELYAMFPDNHKGAKAIWKQLSEEQKEGFLNDLDVTDAASEHIKDSWLEFINAKSEKDWLKNATNWDEMKEGGSVNKKDKEVTEKRYDDLLGAVPPIYFIKLDGVSVKGGFALGEAHTHTTDGKKVYTGLYKDGNKFYETFVKFVSRGEAVRVSEDDFFKYKKGGKVGGRGFFGLTKGKKIEDISEIKVGDIILGHSNQFNADNTYKIINKREHGTVIRFDMVYWNPIENERIGNEEMSIGDLDLSSTFQDEFYFPKDKKFEGGGELSMEEIVLSKLNSDGEISCDEFKQIIGREPCYPVCSVGELKLRKQFLRGCYKKI